MMPSTTNRVPVQRWVPAVLLAGSLLVAHGAKAQWALPPLGGAIPGGAGAGTGYGGGGMGFGLPGSAIGMGRPGDGVGRGWTFRPAISAQAGYTTNVELAPRGQEQGSFILGLTPAIGVRGAGPRATLIGTASVQGLYYTDGNEKTSVYPNANLLGTVEALENFFFVDGAINISQQYLSPYGPQPIGGVGATDNRYTSYAYSVSPYFRGILPGEIRYLVRDDNFWSNLSGAASDTPGFTSTYTNRLIGRLESPIRVFGWSADANRTYTRFSNDSPALTLELARGTLNYRPAPQWLLFATGGYEHNEGGFTESSGAIYGGGFAWRPDERTYASAGWEERFFGGSYFADLSHRSPSWVFGLNASKTATTYPQLLFSVPAGGNVAALVDAAFATRITDPVQRAAAVDQFLQQRGLPSQLQSPLNVYTQQITLSEQQTATIGFVGTRNTLVFTVYNRKSEAIAASGEALPPPFGAINNNTQRGASLVFAHRLTALTNVSATANRFNTIASEPFTGKSTTNFVQLSGGTRVGARTTLFTGVNYTNFDSDVSTDYDAVTVFVGAFHTF